MATVGIIAVVIFGLVVLGGIVLVLTSIPDIRRYRRIRSM
jgi:hypothetical protein